MAKDQMVRPAAAVVLVEQMVPVVSLVYMVVQVLLITVVVGLF